MLAQLNFVYLVVFSFIEFGVLVLDLFHFILCVIISSFYVIILPLLCMSFHVG